MQIESKTRTRITKKGEPEVILSMTILPRGSGNRAKIKRLAEAARASEMGPHIKRIVAGASRLSIYFRPSLGMMAAVLRFSDKSGRDVEGQLPLFA